MTIVSGIVAALLIAAASTTATAQGDWPRRTISLVVPYAPGGYTDSVGRERVSADMTKWAVQIEDPRSVPELVSRAFHIATHG